jgi:branched-chain amino acid transport system substrate-binding protein
MLRLAGCALLCTMLATPKTTYAVTAGVPGVTDTTIKIGAIIDHSGFGQPFCRPIEAGDNVVFNRINAAGGVFGRKIQFITEDDSYSAANSQAAMRKLVEQDGVFAVMQVCGSDGTNAVLPYTEGHGIPLFDPISGAVPTAGTHWTWVTQGQYRDEATVIAAYAVRKLGAKRVALVYQAGEVGDPALQGLTAALPKLGAKLVASEPFLPIQADFSGALGHLRAANPDVVVLSGIVSPAATFMQQAARIHYRPHLGFIGTYPLGDHSWIRASGPWAQGALVSSYGDISGQAPAARAYIKAVGATPTNFSAYGYYGFYNATLFITALQKAGRNLTRASLQHALDTGFHNYDSGFGPPITWTPAQHLAIRQFALFKVTGYVFAQVTPFVGPAF